MYNAADIAVAINYDTTVIIINFNTKKPRKQGEDLETSVVTHNHSPQGFSATKQAVEIDNLDSTLHPLICHAQTHTVHDHAR